MTKNEKALLGRLKKKKRAELLFIMEQLLEHKPDIIPLMEQLMELPSTPLTQQRKSSSNGKQSMRNLAKIQHQVKTIVHQAIRRGGRESAFWSAAELEQVCKIGDSFANAGQWADAQAIYATVAEEAIASYELLEDECQIAEVIDRCADGLVFCLDTQSKLLENERLDAANRKELLASLFNIWEFERDYGGITLDITDAILRNLVGNEC